MDFKDQESASDKFEWYSPNLANPRATIYCKDA